MCRLINRLICLIILLIIAVAALSFYSGGGQIRQFGITVKEYSEDLADMADNFRKEVEKTIKCISNARDKLQDLFGGRDDGTDKR